jgi:hypothetical protein
MARADSTGPTLGCCSAGSRFLPPLRSRWGTRSQVAPRPSVHKASVRRLLGEQLQRLGADVRDPLMHRLLAVGMTRHRPPDGMRGATAYVWPVADGTLVVWGFGVWFGAPGEGSIFLGRHTPLPVRWAPFAEAPSHIHHPRALTAWKRPRVDGQTQIAHHLAARAMRWLARYEELVSEDGAPRSCENSRADSRGSHASAAWRAMANRFTSLPDPLCSKRTA